MIELNQIKIEPFQSNSNWKSYFCPHCKKMLMKGNVKKLSMACPNCQKMIDADEKDLLESNDDK
jgi:uncharacterized CHY-type Zn-finger protein